jgi:nucleosome binding factor SPN SPT16 subunit
MTLRRHDDDFPTTLNTTENYVEYRKIKSSKRPESLKKLFDEIIVKREIRSKKKHIGLYPSLYVSIPH